MNPPTPFPIPAAFADLRVTGELGHRLAANLNRLEESKYQPEHVFLSEAENGGWHGDTEGRTLLALALDGQAAGREPAYFAEILRRLPEHLNERGYFGPVYPAQVFSEQQLASHGWVLRALCETYAWRGEAQTLDQIARILSELVLPSAGFYADYPLDAQTRAGGGGFGGVIQNAAGHWLLSSDTCCNLILLDGIVHAYQFLPSPALRAVIEEMIDLFARLDLAAIKAQTHASLSAVRGVLRYYETNRDPHWLALAQERYQLYRTAAMTANFENDNWFGRPEWTEPCAVIDSFLAAVGLWRFTHNPAYLEDAHRIYYNGICAEQRANGGFGCNSCAGSSGSPFLEVATDEAHWCCTMRGGEGLSRAAQFTYFTQGGAVYLPFFHDSQAALRLESGVLRVRQESGYPFTGRVRLEIVENTCAQPVTLHFFAGEWCAQARLTRGGAPAPTERTPGWISTAGRFQPGDILELCFAMALERKPYQADGTWQYFYGPLVFGRDVSADPDPAAAAVQRAPDGMALTPVYHLLDPAVSSARGFRKQIVFGGL
jgi:hypothetical protein